VNPEDREILIRVDERVGTLLGNQADQEKRIRKLERWRNIMAGLIAALGSAFGYKSNPFL